MPPTPPTPPPTSAHVPMRDPHQESRERAERLLAAVARELLANPSPGMTTQTLGPSEPSSSPRQATRSHDNPIHRIAGLRA